MREMKPPVVDNFVHQTMAIGIALAVLVQIAFGFYAVLTTLLDLLV